MGGSTVFVNIYLFEISEILIDCNIDGRFGGLINGRKAFQELSGNTFFFNSSLTLVFGGEENSNAIQWRYSQRSDLLLSQTLTPTYASTETGLSWITISNTQQGFYRCEINSSLSYTIGLYDLSLTAGWNSIALSFCVK